MFSDTIVFTLPYPDSSDEKWRKRARQSVSLVSGKLTEEMFNKGLPLRGALHEGEFITKESCIAGSGIVEAYTLCHSLDYAGLACTELFGEMVTNERKSSEESYFFDYLTPITDGTEKKLFNTIGFVSYLRKTDRMPGRC